MRRPLISILVAASCLATPAFAQSSIEDAVRAEVLSGYAMPDGRRMAALRLTLAPGWKTYWRAPGDAGIPPRFNWRRAGNVQDVTVSWPTPEVFYEYGMRSIGYKNSIVLPLAIQPKSDQREVLLRGTMHLGICSDVCVPHEIDINAALEPPTARPTPEIAAALASMPYSAGEADVSSAVCRVTPMEDGMRIEARITLPSTGANEVTVIEPGIPEVWTSEPATTRQGNTLVAVSEMMHMDSKPFSVDRSRVRITVLGGNYAVDIKGCTGS